MLILRPYSYASILHFLFHGNTTGLAVFIPTEAPGAGKLLKMLSVFAYFNIYVSIELFLPFI